MERNDNARDSGRDPQASKGRQSIAERKESQAENQVIPLALLSALPPSGDTAAQIATLWRNILSLREFAGNFVGQDKRVNILARKAIDQRLTEVDEILTDLMAVTGLIRRLDPDAQYAGSDLQAALTAALTRDVSLWQKLRVKFF